MPNGIPSQRMTASADRCAVFAAGASRGGVADVFRRVVSELRLRGHAVTVADIPDVGSGALAAVRTAISHRRSVRAADVVHVEFGSNDAEVFWFALATSFLRPDCVVVAHDHPKLVLTPGAALLPSRRRWQRALAFRLLSPLLDQLLIAVLLRRAGVLVVFGEQARAGWLARGAENVEVIAHGGDRPEPSAVGRSPSAGESVVLAGHLGPSKGLDILLEAWERISTAVSLQLLVAGQASPPHHQWLEALRQRFTQIANPPRFLGRIDDEGAFQTLIAEAALVILPYRFSSPASGILVRALSAGRPVIATPVPAVTAALVDGENGVLIPIGDVAALAEAIVRLAGSPADRDRLGAAAARSAERLFTWEAHLAGLERAYDRAQRAGNRLTSSPADL